MKNSVTYLKYLLFLSFSISLFVFSTGMTDAENKEYKNEGYIITKEGDKIDGFVIVKKSLTYDEVKIKFISKKGKKKSYKAKDLSGYSYKSMEENEAGNIDWMWTHYESRKVKEPPIPFGPREVFMERLEEGDVTIFEYWIQVNTDVENPYKRYFFLEREGERVKLTRDDFVEESKAFFSDNEVIVEKMGGVNHRFRHMRKVTKRYNDWKIRQKKEVF